MKTIDPNNKDQIASVAAVLVQHARNIYTGAGGWRGQYGDKAIEAFAQAAEVIKQYPEKLEKVKTGVMNRSEAREWFSGVYSLLGNAQTAASVAHQHALNAYKTAEVGILGAFADIGLPEINVTIEQLARAASRFVLRYDDDSEVLCLCYPDFEASVFDGAVRRTWKGVKLHMPLAMGHDTTSWIYETDGTTCASGYAGQFHPHILSSTKPCWGGSGNIIKTAMQEGRIADVCDTMFELMVHPRDNSLSHLQCLASMPDSEAKCQKCGKWHRWGEYGDDSDMQVIKFSKVKDKDDEFQVHVLCDANFLICPDTGLRFPENKGVKYNGVPYHKSAIVAVINSHGLPESVPKSMSVSIAGAWYLKTSVKTCCVTGIAGLPISPSPDSGRYITKSPLDLVPLEGGKHVLACCLDLTDQYGPLTLEGILNVSRQTPWWQNRIDTRLWSSFSPWMLKHLAGTYSDIAKRLAGPATATAAQG